MRTSLTPALKYEIVELIDERIRERHVTREDFAELKDIVKELAEAQKELAEAQKRTELRVEELAEAQKRTELRVEELAEAQKASELRLTRLEQVVEELAEAQKELAEAQKETQKEIRELALNMRYIRRDLGGITSTLGFMLENEAYRVLPDILKERYAIEVKERFLRKSIRSFGIDEEGELNIFSFGVDRNKGKKVMIIGEAKSQLGKDDIDNLLNTVAKLEKIDKEAERFLLAITHYTRETVFEYAKEKGVKVIQSFEW